MSIRVMTSVWENSQHKGSALLLLLAIADHAADDGYAWPSVDALARKIRMSRRHTIRLIQQLEESGEIRVIRHVNNRYVVTVGMTGEEVEETIRRRCAGAGAEADGDKMSGDKLSPGGDKMSPSSDKMSPAGDTCVTLTIKETSNKPSMNPSGFEPGGSNGDGQRHRRSPPKPPPRKQSLEPSTPQALALFERLRANARAKGRRGPKRFPSYECMEKFDAAASALDLDGEFDRALTKALEQGITSVVGVTNYVAKWAERATARAAPKHIQVSR